MYVLINMGRKLEFKERRTISTYLEAAELEALNDIRWRERKAMSEIIRLAIDEYIKAHGAGNETFRLDNWQRDPTFQAVPTILADPTDWFKYLSDCTPEERSKILKQANTIRNNAISIGNFKKK